MINEGSAIMQNQYYYSPATRFQNSFMNPAVGQSVPTGQFGTLGYNPNMQYNPTPQYSNYGMNLNGGVNLINNYVDRTVVINGYNPSNTESLMTDEIEKKMNDLAKKMYEEQENQISRQRELMSANPYNYYGYMNSGYMNPYTLSKYRTLQNQLYEEAVSNRIDFNKKLSMGARRYLGMDISEEEINTIYDPRTVTIPASQIQAESKTEKLAQFTIDNGELTKRNYNMASNEITDRHDKIIDEKSNLEQFLNNAGRMIYEIEFEKLQAEKRDKSSAYQSGESFRNYINQQVYKRDGGGMMSSLFPTLSNSSSILEDGTISIKCPDWIKKNESESNYEADRQRFIQSIYNP